MPIFNNGPGASGITLQGLIGLVIAAVALISYYERTSINPTTGEKQHVAMTPGQEIQLGLAAAPQMEREMGGEVPFSSRAAQEVQKIGLYVMRHSDAARSPYRDDFQYHLLADPRTINAFALPGGQVFITRGLYDHLTTEAQLAAVLGHETGHVIERHAAQQMAKGQLGQLLVTAAGIGASSSNHPGRGYGAAAVAGVIDKMKQLSFSRHDETQADECGLTYMTEAGFDPRAMLKVMEILQQVTAATGRQPEMFQTHPYPQHRMEDISAWIKSHYPGGVPSNLTQGGALPR